jgi:uncharacterized membrane protein (DUF106 family)
MAFSDFLSPILLPLLESVGSFWTIVIVSFFVSGLTTIVYKYTTDQTKLRKLKADLKRHQKKAQQLQKEDPKKAMALQKEMMKLNGQFMKSSLRSTLYTFLPVILFFGWLSAFLSFAPVVPGAGFDITVDVLPSAEGPVTLDLPEGFSVATNLTKYPVDNQVSWRLSAETAGSYELILRHVASEEEFILPIEVSSNQAQYAPVLPVNGVAFDTVTVGYQKLQIFDGIFILQDIPWVNNWGWLGAYILFSLIFSTSMRKLLKLA